MLKRQPIFVAATALLLALLAAGFAAEPRRLSVYAPQSSYSLDLLEYDGVEYAGLAELLDPLGHLEWHVKGKKLILLFNGTEAEFQQGKRQVRIGAAKLELPDDFLFVDGRGYVSEASIRQLLQRITGQPVEFHATARRLFVGSSQLRFAAELRHNPSRLVLSFTAPVKPSVSIEKSRVRLLFHQEPIVGGGAESVPYNDPFLLGTSFVELSGGAEFIANVQQPSTVTVAEDGRTVTIAAVPPPPPPPVATPAAPSSVATNPAPRAQPAPAPRVRPFVILDAGHGGGESGAELSPTLLEKSVNLALARRLQKELESRGIPVVLTRVADNALAWDQRAVSANTSHASLYVALHASASGHGVRFYTAMLPAAAPGQPQRSFLPWEQAQSPYLAQSSAAAATLSAECASNGLPVRSAIAAVRPLNSVTLAAVAVEVSPLGSSPDELANAEYQQRVAGALAAGISRLRGQWEAAR